MSKQKILSDMPHAKIGLALGSGSARGLAHIGVLRAIEESGLKIDFIAGASIGALVGAIYAAGYLDKLEATFKTFDWRKIASLIDPVLPQSGLIEGRKIMEFVQAHLPASRLEALPIPVHIVTTDILTGKEIVINEGDLHQAIRASIAIPGIFTPVCDNAHVLVDGGLVNPVPVNVVRAMGADFVIAVTLNHEIARNNKVELALDNGASPEEIDSMYHKVADKLDKNIVHSLGKIRQAFKEEDISAFKRFKKWLEPETLPNIFEIIVSSINIMGAKISESRMKIDLPELIIRPPLGDVHFLAFDQADKIIAAGYKTARQALTVINHAKPSNPSDLTLHRFPK